MLVYDIKLIQLVIWNLVIHFCFEMLASSIEICCKSLEWKIILEKWLRWRSNTGVVHGPFFFFFFPRKILVKKHLGELQCTIYKTPSLHFSDFFLLWRFHSCATATSTHGQSSCNPQRHPAKEKDVLQGSQHQISYLVICVYISYISRLRLGHSQLSADMQRQWDQRHHCPQRAVSEPADAAKDPRSPRSAQGAVQSGALGGSGRACPLGVTAAQHLPDAGPAAAPHRHFLSNSLGDVLELKQGRESYSLAESWGVSFLLRRVK